MVFRKWSSFPPTPPERSEAGLDDIPCGARVQNAEVAAAISMEIAAGIVAYS
ncbi:hypothetical protein [Priestia megaterium]|uniref:hypothetical protein n=1 Tax=Priestia megaterium TaxID=1404 RepID=UPI0028780CAA|nr:hypothetical protein [Priestia megaterium]